MNCQEFQRLRALSPWLPAGMDARLEARLRSHAVQCVRCREQAAREGAVPDLLRQAYTEEAGAYVAARPLPSATYRAARGRGRWVLAGAVCCGGVLLAFTLHPARREQVAAREGVHPLALAPHTSQNDKIKDLAWIGAAPRGKGNIRFAATARPRKSGPVTLNHAGPDTPAPANIRRAPVPDEQYLDGRDAQLAAGFLGQDSGNTAALDWLNQPLPPIQDDFVRVTPPRLASTDGKAAGDAIRRYEDEAKVVDPRLFRKVTLHCKAVALDELCGQIAGMTGVKVQAARGVADEKVTVLVEDRPAREVMREAARLFGYLFARTGEPGAYKYTLEQDLRSQLAEEELRSRDVHQALLSLDGEVGWFRQFAEQDIDGLLARVERDKDGKDPVAQRLYRYVKGGGWGPAQFYFRLSPDERNELLAGKQLRYTLDDPNPARRIPREWRDKVLKTSGLHLFPTGVIIENPGHEKPSTPIQDVPGAQAGVVLRLNRSEAGEIALEVGTEVQYETPQGTSGGGARWELAKGRGPSASPENAKANAALRNLPPFQQKISLNPKPSCPRLAEEEARRKRGEEREEFIFEPELKEPHVNSADVWEEIHARTGMPVVADAYTHLYRLSQVQMKETSTFDALCQAGDRMGVRWRKDGDFLLGRGTAFFWDKQKEVPNRMLRAWEDDRDRNHGLPLEDLLEMATLSDQQLGSKNVGMGITHCRGLGEWGIIGGGPFVGGEIVPEELRKEARGLSLLTPAQLAQARKPEGLSARDLLPRQIKVVEEQLNWYPTGQDPYRFHVEYVPAGRFVWRPLVDRTRYEAEAKRWPHISAATRDEALAQARKWDPQASAKDIQRTRGRLDLIFINQNGEWIGQGGPMVLAPLE